MPNRRGSSGGQPPYIGHPVCFTTVLPSVPGICSHVHGEGRGCTSNPCQEGAVAQQQSSGPPDWLQHGRCDPRAGACWRPRCLGNPQLLARAPLLARGDIVGETTAGPSGAVQVWHAWSPGRAWHYHSCHKAWRRRSRPGILLHASQGTKQGLCAPGWLIATRPGVYCMSWSLHQDCWFGSGWHSGHPPSYRAPGVP